MPVAYDIKIRNNRTGEEHGVTGQFSGEDWAILANFAAVSDELEEAEYVKARLPLDSAMRWSENEGWEIPELPPAAQIREFLHLLRPLILEKENTYLPKVVGILWRQLDEEFFRINLRRVKDGFFGKTMREYSQWVVGELVINSDKGLNLWLNALEYHRDEDKRALLEKIGQAVPLEVLKVQFIELLRYKYEAIAWVAGLIRTIERAPTAQGKSS